MPQPFTLATPLPVEMLALESFTATEGLSELTEIVAVAVSPSASLDSNAMLGQPAHLEIGLRNDATRHLHGYITRFAQRGMVNDKFRYEVVLRPWLWFLSRTVDCRVFQNLSVPDIVKQVFADHKIANFNFNLFRTYRLREYCVQYRESDLAFVSRLLEEEGIYFSFVHSKDAHCASFHDSNSAHDDLENGYDSLPMFATSEGVAQNRDFVSDWRWERRVQSGVSVLADYDDTQAHLSMEGESIISRDYDLSDYEVFDYPGGFTTPDDGLQYASNRLDELQTRFETFSGSSNAHGIEVARTMSLTRNPRADQAHLKYLVVRASMHGRNGSHSAGDPATAGAAMQCRFTAIDAAQQFRPARRTGKPFVRGPQTAFVVGADNKEIDSDEQGRVRVQFHWDRYGKRDDHSSCAIRVAQIWAGKNFGALFLPRVGHEVIVDFLEGDPDRPIITGSVYNSSNRPPWNCNHQASVSGIVSRSTPGGNVKNANSLRFDDKKGAENLALHAELNMSTSVENDQSLSVGHDRTTNVGNFERNTIKGGRRTDIDPGLNPTADLAFIHGIRRTVIDAIDDRTVLGGVNDTITIASESTVLGVRSEVTSDFHYTKAKSQLTDIETKLASQAGEVISIADGNHTTVSHGVYEVQAKEMRFFTDEGMTFYAKGDTTRYANKVTDHALGPKEAIAHSSSSTRTVGTSDTTTVSYSKSTALGMSLSMGLSLEFKISAGASFSASNFSVSGNMLSLSKAAFSKSTKALWIIDGGAASSASGSAGQAAQEAAKEAAEDVAKEAVEGAAEEAAEDAAEEAAKQAAAEAAQDAAESSAQAIVSSAAAPVLLGATGVVGGALGLTAAGLAIDELSAWLLGKDAGKDTMIGTLSAEAGYTPPPPEPPAPKPSAQSRADSSDIAKRIDAGKQRASSTAGSADVPDGSGDGHVR